MPKCEFCSKNPIKYTILFPLFNNNHNLKYFDKSKLITRPLPFYIKNIHKNVPENNLSLYGIKICFFCYHTKYINQETNNDITLM